MSCLIVNLQPLIRTPGDWDASRKLITKRLCNTGDSEHCDRFFTKKTIGSLWDRSEMTLLLIFILKIDWASLSFQFPILFCFLGRRRRANVGNIFDSSPVGATWRVSLSECCQLSPHIVNKCIVQSKCVVYIWEPKEEWKNRSLSLTYSISMYCLCLLNCFKKKFFAETRELTPDGPQTFTNIVILPNIYFPDDRTYQFIRSWSTTIVLYSTFLAFDSIECITIEFSSRSSLVKCVFRQLWSW